MAYTSVGGRCNTFPVVAYNFCSIPGAKEVSAIRYENVSERPSIRCLARSKQFATLELVQKPLMADTARATVDYSTTFEKDGKRRENQHDSAKREE